MFECRIRKSKFPRDGEVVIGKTASVRNDVVTMELLEYGGISGLVLASELSKKRIKAATQVTKVGNVEVCQVLRVEESKGFIDLSLKRVSDKERQECRESFFKAKLAYQIVAKACKLSGQSVRDVYETWAYGKEDEYGSLFSYFAHAKNNLGILDAEPGGEHFRKVIEEQFKASSFKVRVDVDVTCTRNGVLGIKEAFNKALEADDGLEIVLLKSPTYSIVKVSGDRDDAFRAVNEACEAAKKSIEAIGGTFSIASPAKVYGEKAKHTALDEKEHDQLSDSD